MISLVVPTLDTLRQWLDDLGMNFFECDTCQALHLPHMQNFDGVYDAKIDLVDNTILFFRDGGGQAFRVAAAGGRSLCYQRQFVDGKSLSRYAG